jgi:hypothetical protein
MSARAVAVIRPASNIIPLRPFLSFLSDHVSSALEGSYLAEELALARQIAKPAEDGFMSAG